jgi:2-amino-4-hydroxy-6-hydroxymethyldihydropteridine diphosphokinase
MPAIYLSIGFNLGVRLANVSRATDLVNEKIGTVEKRSSLYESSPWGYESDNEYINCVVLVRTVLSPQTVINTCKEIEKEMGRREETENKYLDRIIDIDLLLYNNDVIQFPGLIVPHPRMHERKFVLLPLYEIAPDLIHPVYRKSMITLLKTTDDPGEVRLYV